MRIPTFPNYQPACSWNKKNAETKAFSSAASFKGETTDVVVLRSKSEDPGGRYDVIRLKEEILSDETQNALNKVYLHEGDKPVTGRDILEYINANGENPDYFSVETGCTEDSFKKDFSNIKSIKKALNELKDSELIWINKDSKFSPPEIGLTMKGRMVVNKDHWK